MRGACLSHVGVKQMQILADKSDMLTVLSEVHAVKNTTASLLVTLAEGYAVQGLILPPVNVTSYSRLGIFGFTRESFW